MTLAPAWAHESPVTLARYQDAYSRGQGAVLDVVMPMLERANAAADYWYVRATYSPAEISELNLRASDEAEVGYWSTHVCDDSCAADPTPDPSASWADARQEA